MNRTTRALVGLGLTLAVTLSAGIVAAHPEHPDPTHPGQDLLGHHQHGGDDGHLPPVRRNVRLVGKLDLFGEAEQPGRVADVAAYGNYAYLGSFREPACDTQENGVYVIDISNPAQPTEAGFIPTTPQSWVGEGVQILDMETPAFDGQVLIHSNESCTWVADEVHSGLGGISLWDVTAPTDPQALAEHVGDEGPTGQMHQVHSAFGWQDGDKAYVVMTDDDEAFVPTGTDIDIMDITDPANPVLISETHIRAETGQDPAPRGNNIFLHDMVVKEVNGEMLLLASYWDGGYSILNVDDPANPMFLRDTDFAAADPFAGTADVPAAVPPEGNAHQAEFSHDNRYFLGADEDFNALSLLGTITSGPLEGETFDAGQSTNTPTIDEDSPLIGPTTYVGNACGPLAPAQSPEHIALIERGGPSVAGQGACTFQLKVMAAEAAGYQGSVIFNEQRADCEAVVTNPLLVGPFPAATVARSTGLQLMNQSLDDNPCDDPTPAVGTPSESVAIEFILDGWGYLHLFDAQTMEDVDQYAIPEALEREHATGSGDLSIHEVAMDPQRNLAYISYYSGGFRVVRFGEGGIEEVGAFIAPGGNNFWGVQYHRPRGQKQPLILASDRDSGLWIFRFGAKT
jgi:hypothetical protein